MPGNIRLSQKHEWSNKSADFLPICREDMEKRGWEECDFVFVSGDAYVDHPSFGAALISRLLEAEGYRVGIIAQPGWQDRSAPEASPFAALGKPRLAFLAGAGNLDSMVANYTSAKKPRSTDAYSPGGRAGLRPDRALIKYVEGIRHAYKNIPVIIGGIEASLRRFAHYDYWSDTVRRSVLLDSKADILVYGMGERAILEIARLLASGKVLGEIQNVRGTCIRSREPPRDALMLPSWENPGWPFLRGREILTPWLPITPRPKSHAPQMPTLPEAAPACAPTGP